MKSFIQKYGGFLFVIIGIIGIFLIESTTTSTAEEVVVVSSASNYEETVVTTADSMYVDIKGAVVYPGVYYCSSNMRIADVVMLAGGLLEEANTKDINLSKTLYDQMVIYIPFQTEVTGISTSHYFFVEIKGAIMNPGVFEVGEGSRIVDVIELAGGLLESADLSGINQSQKIVDEMVIYIPMVSEGTSENYITVTLEGAVLYPGSYQVKSGSLLSSVVMMAGGILDDADITGLLWNQEMTSSITFTIPFVSSSLQETEESLLVNLNTASLDELMTLNGIGIILGQRIIDYRAENGFFDSIEDVMNVSGIKESIYGQIKDDITV
ncbi:MAG: SLBB domain-containing protein [Candidatus Izemoplasmatales bacterium]